MKQHMLTHKMRDMSQHMFEHSMRSTSLERDSGHSMGSNQNYPANDEMSSNDVADDYNDELNAVQYRKRKRGSLSVSDDGQQTKDTEADGSERDLLKRHDSHVTLASNEDDGNDDDADVLAKRRHLGE